MQLIPHSAFSMKARKSLGAPVKLSRDFVPLDSKLNFISSSDKIGRPSQICFQYVSATVVPHVASFSASTASFIALIPELALSTES